MSEGPAATLNGDPVVPDGFEIYRRQRTRRPAEPTVTLTARGIIAISKAAYRLLGEPAAVVLLWAKDDRVVGLRPAAAGEQNAYRCRPTPGAGRMVSAFSFLRWAGIQGDGARRPLVLDEGIGCVMLPASMTSP